MAPTGTTTTTTAAFAQLTTYTWSGSQSTWARTNVYGDGEMLATYDSVGAGLHFHLTDHLGTRRVQTDPTGTPETDCQSLPYGDSQYCFAAPGSAATGASDDDATPLHFTGKQRDVESGNDYFEARYYASNAGRFMSPDWSATVESVPYARMDSPQSLNLYAYVSNNPLGSADPDGHRQPNLTDRFGCSDGEYCDGNSGQPYDSLTTAVRDAAAIGGTPFDGAMEFLGALYSANQAQQQSTTSGQDDSHYVSVSYYPKGAGGFGHTGIAVDSDDTHGFSTADPHVPWYKRLFGAPAARMEDDLEMHTNSDGVVAPHSYIHIPISAAQAGQIQGAIDARTANPEQYNLFFNNCAQEVGSALHAGGVGGVPHGEVFIPAIFDAATWYTNTWR